MLRKKYRGIPNNLGKIHISSQNPLPISWNLQKCSQLIKFILMAVGSRLLQKILCRQSIGKEWNALDNQRLKKGRQNNRWSLVSAQKHRLLKSGVPRCGLTWSRCRCRRTRCSCWGCLEAQKGLPSLADQPTDKMCGEAAFPPSWISLQMRHPTRRRLQKNEIYTRVFRKNWVFSLNFQNFATSPSQTLGYYWLYRNWPVNSSDCTLRSFERMRSSPTGREGVAVNLQKNTIFPDHPVVCLSSLQ